MEERTTALLLLLTLLPSTSAVDDDQSCYTANWWNDVAQNRRLSKCDTESSYLNGLWRNSPGNDTTDYIEKLETGYCCYLNDSWEMDTHQVVYAKWDNFSKINEWSYCPEGFFLHGIWVERGKWLSSIKYGRCSKPASHPRRYLKCYDHDVSECFNNRGLCKCEVDYFLTGLYHSMGSSLRDIDTFRCCQMMQSPSEVRNVDEAKERIQDTTQVNLAFLAHYLGYEYCLGCRAEATGEDFNKNSHGWEADKSALCTGNKSSERLKIEYGNWKMELSSFEYYPAETEIIEPEATHVGLLVNSKDFTAEATVKHIITSIRLVEHRKFSSWAQSNAFGAEFMYSPLLPVSISSPYAFNYTNSQTTRDLENNQDIRIFKFDSFKTLPPHSKVQYSMALTKTRVTLKYTAMLSLKFSVELQGFLRYGDGYNGSSTNFHYQHRGSKDTPDCKHMFGHADYPMWTDLHRQSLDSLQPWMWRHAEHRWPSMINVVSDLADECQYDFYIRGQFRDTIGTYVTLRFDWLPYNHTSPHKENECPEKASTTTTKPAPTETSTRYLGWPLWPTNQYGP